ncbi:hypothetical protein ACIQOU_10270 [Streptomyces sp. NPDC091279]
MPGAREETAATPLMLALKVWCDGVTAAADPEPGADLPRQHRAGAS